MPRGLKYMHGNLPTGLQSKIQPDAEQERELKLNEEKETLEDQEIQTILNDISTGNQYFLDATIPFLKLKTD